MSLKLGATDINKSYLGATEIKKAYLGSTVIFDNSSAVPEPSANIISRYTFEDNANDVVGSNNGVASNLTYEVGFVSKRGVFNGSTSEIVVPDAADLSFGSGGVDLPFSISHLIEFDDLTTTWYIGKDAGGTSREWLIGLFGDRLSIYLINADNSGRLQAGAPIGSVTAGVGMHIVFTYDGSKTVGGIKCYIDGVNVALTDASTGTYVGMSNTTAELYIGSSEWIAGDYFLNGKVDEVILWDKELTQTEITALVALQLPVPLVSFGFGSDLHYGTINDYAGRYPSDGDSKLTDAVTDWNAESLDFAFFNGDYTDNGHIAFTPETDHATALVNLAYIETVYDDFVGTRYYSLGNHDTDKLSKAEMIANTAMTAKYYSFTVNTIKFIVLDATYLSDDDADDFDSGNQDPGNHLTDWIPPIQRTWLDTELSTATGKVVVFCHQSLHSDVDNLSVNNASVVRGILETYGNVIGVISGHEHINLLTTINSIPYYSMDAMTSGAYPANAYAVIRILSNDVIKIEGRGTQTSYN